MPQVDRVLRSTHGCKNTLMSTEHLSLFPSVKMRDILKMTSMPYRHAVCAQGTKRADLQLRKSHQQDDEDDDTTNLRTS